MIPCTKEVLQLLDKKRPGLAQNLRDILTFADKPHMSMSKFQHNVLAAFIHGVADGDEGWRSPELMDISQRLYLRYRQVSNDDCAPCYECGGVTLEECFSCAARYYQESVKRALTKEEIICSQ